MFTGIVTDVGEIISAENNGDLRLRVRTRYDPASMDDGASIACGGVCLTVVETGPDWFGVDVSVETRTKTTAGCWRSGMRINLERPLRPTDELGGHIVSGHVDGTVTLTEIRPDGESLRFSFDLPGWLRPFIAAKGSVALDGVSLTVNDVEDSAFGVNIIPHTRTVTTFGDRNPGDVLNVEIDMLARYVHRAMSVR